MPALTDPQSEPDAVTDSVELKRLAEDIVSRHRSRVRELCIEAAKGGVVLRGRSRTYYGKQVVLHEVRQSGLVVLANEIVVCGNPFGVAPA